MITELRTAYDEAENDDNVWIIIVTGTGRAFCTGADVKEIPEDGKVINERPYLSTYDQWEAPQEGTPPFRRMAKPVLAAINGIVLRRRPGLGHHRRHRHRLRQGHVLRPARQHRPGRRARDGAAGPGAAPQHRAAHGADGQARTDERGARLRTRHDQRGRRARQAPRTRPRDRRHRELECAAGRAGHPAGHPQDPRPAAARSRDPRRDVPRAVVRTEDALEGPKAFVEKRAPNWQCR